MPSIPSAVATKVQSVALLLIHVGIKTKFHADVNFESPGLLRQAGPDFVN